MDETLGLSALLRETPCRIRMFNRTTLRENRVVIHGGPSACRSHAAKARVPDFQRAMAVFLVP